MKLFAITPNIIARSFSDRTMEGGVLRSTMLFSQVQILFFCEKSTFVMHCRISFQCSQ